MSPQRAALWVWLIWYVTWWLAAFWASRAAARPKLSVGVLHRLVASLGVWLLFGPMMARHFPRFVALAGPAWSAPSLVGWTLVALIVLSFAFCWWARLHLGRLWSGLTTVKADHRIIESGPYGLVRHPIYTGVIAAALFTAALAADLVALAGAALIGLGFWMTARAEERFLRQALGAQAYDAYARRIPMLVPGIQ